MGDKKTKQTIKKTAVYAGDSTLNIPTDYLVLLRDHPEGRNKILDNYKSKLLIIVSKHKDLNVYTIHPVGSCVYHQLMAIVSPEKLCPRDTPYADPVDSSSEAKIPFLAKEIGPR